MFEYQGHRVSLLWQSKHARRASFRVAGRSQTGSARTGGFGASSRTGQVARALATRRVTTRRSARSCGTRAASPAHMHPSHQPCPGRQVASRVIEAGARAKLADSEDRACREARPPRTVPGAVPRRPVVHARADRGRRARSGGHAARPTAPKRSAIGRKRCVNPTWLRRARPPRLPRCESPPSETN